MILRKNRYQRYSAERLLPAEENNPRGIFDRAVLRQLFWQAESGRSRLAGMEAEDMFFRLVKQMKRREGMQPRSR